MRPLFILFTILLASLFKQVIAEDLDVNDPRFNEIRDNTIIPYYETLKKGEVDSLHTYLSTQRYAVNRILIEQNELYPEHLRNHFRDAMFDLVRVIQEGEKITALVKIYWPDGDNTFTTLGLVEEKAVNLSEKNVRWKIDRD